MGSSGDQEGSKKQNPHLFFEPKGDFDGTGNPSSGSEDEILNDGDDSFSLIQAYLSLGATAETAALAAAMAPRASEFDPALLIDQALALETEVEAGVKRQREAMVARMGNADLFILLKKLRVENLDDKFDPHNERLQDPIIGPALRKYHETAPPDYLKLAEQWRIADVLAAADKRTYLPRPILPCILEEALRYAANAPKAPWSALEKAHEDCREISIPFNDEGEGAAYLKSLPLVKQLKLLKSSKTIVLPTRFIPAGPSPEILESTIPGSNTIEGVDSNPDDSNAESIFTERDLAALVSDFYSFWQEHGSFYEEKEKLFRDKGATGASIRDRKVWISRTKDFVKSDDLKKFLEYAPRLQTNKFFQRALDSFFESYKKAGTNSPAAKEKTKKFLFTLFTHRDKKMAAHQLITFKKTLNTSGIKSMSDDTVLECHRRLKSRLD